MNHSFGKQNFLLVRLIIIVCLIKSSEIDLMIRDVISSTRPNYNADILKEFLQTRS